MSDLYSAQALVLAAKPVLYEGTCLKSLPTILERGGLTSTLPFSC